MRKLLFILGVIFSASAAFSQQASSDYIKLDSTVTYTNYNMVWKTAILNQVVAFTDTRHQPVMLICLPANGAHSPVPGTYTIDDGNKRTVKKGSQTAKLQYEPGYVSVADGGTLTITENDGIFWFSADNVSVINTKTKETHKLSFKSGMFIEKN